MFLCTGLHKACAKVVGQTKFSKMPYTLGSLGSKRGSASLSQTLLAGRRGGHAQLIAHGWEMCLLHAATKTQHQVERGLLLNVVVRQGTAIFQLFAGEDETLLIWWDAFFILDFGFYVIDCVAGLHIEGDGFACERLDEDLHAAAETQHQVERGLLLNVVVRQGTAILQLFASEDETLLIWRDAFFILDFGFHVIDRVAGLHIEGDSFACQSLDKDLHDCAGRCLRLGAGCVDVSTQIASGSSLSQNYFLSQNG